MLYYLFRFLEDFNIPASAYPAAVTDIDVASNTQDRKSVV